MHRAALLVSALLLACGGSTVTGAGASRASVDSTGRLIAQLQGSDYAWTRLTQLCDGIGHRLSGSASLEEAIDWAVADLNGIEGVNAWEQPVMVPHWVRGEESLAMVSPTAGAIAMVGLGNSVGTGGTPVEASVVVLSSLDELEARSDEVDGRVVLFDVPMPDYDAENHMPGYGAVVGVRVNGPAQAASHGAVAVIIRSLTNDPTSPPHTGVTRYPEGGPRIPAAAITIPDAERIHRMVDDGQEVVLRLSMGAEDRGEAESANVIAELRGTEHANEVVVLGGHMDSWDVGQGCHDDGSGVVSAMAALHAIVESGLRPRRTLRVVLWTNEENGLRGATAYAEEYGRAAPHVAGIESDSGAARVIGLQFWADDEHADAANAQVATMIDRMRPVGVYFQRGPGFAGADLRPLQELGIPGIGIVHDPSRYFDLHHTATDTLAAVDREDFEQGVAVMAVTAFTVADQQLRFGESMTDLIEGR